MNKASLLDELERLTAPAPSDAQRQELRDRLAHHRAHPDEPGVTLDDIRRELKQPNAQSVASHAGIQPEYPVSPRLARSAEAGRKTS